MKESKRSFEESSVTEEEGLNLKRISTSSTEASSIFSSTSMTSIAEDEELRLLYGQRDSTVYSDDGQRDSHMYSDNDDACSNSHSTASSTCSTSSRSSQNSTSPSSPCNNSNYLPGCLPEENRTDYFSHPDKDCGSRSQIHSARSRNKSTNIYAGKTIFDICDNEIWKGRIETQDNGNMLTSCDLSNRNTNQDLRSLRQMLNSQDVMVKTLDSCKLDNVRRTHCAITELDEDCVTMDIVSTI